MIVDHAGRPVMTQDQNPQPVKPLIHIYPNGKSFRGYESRPAGQELPVAENETLIICLFDGDADKYVCRTENVEQSLRAVRATYEDDFGRQPSSIQKFVPVK